MEWFVYVRIAASDYIIVCGHRGQRLERFQLEPWLRLCQLGPLDRLQGWP